MGGSPKPRLNLGMNHIGNLCIIYFCDFVFWLFNSYWLIGYLQTPSLVVCNYDYGNMGLWEDDDDS